MRYTTVPTQPGQNGAVRGYYPVTGYQYSGPTRAHFKLNEDENYEGIGEFIFDNIFWMLIAMAWYRGLLFRNIEHCTSSTSKLVLWGLVLIFTFLGTILDIKHHRKSRNVFFNVVMGYGIYTALTYIHIYSTLINTVLLCTAVSIAAFVAILIYIRQRNLRSHRYRVKLNFMSALLFAQKITGIGLFLIIIVTGVNRLVNPFLLKANNSTASKQNIEEQTIENNMDTLVVLYDGTWEALTVQERIDVLQTVANIEQRYLGLPHELIVGAANTDDNEAGCYNDKTHRIVVSMDCLFNYSPDYMVNTICHEAYHAYQYRLVDLWMNADQDSRSLKIFRRIRSYAEEFKNYTDIEDDLYSYYTQRCESDARDYADDAEWDYRRKVCKYLYPVEEDDISFTLPPLEELFSLPAE